MLLQGERIGSTALALLGALAAAIAMLGCEISRDEEVQLGSDFAAEINAQLPLVDDPAVTGYVQALGERIAGTADERALAWHFHVVNSDAVNAFAIPGGHVYVNRGLIERVHAMPQLAGVLGHEIGHVTMRHSVEQMQTAQKTNIGVAVVCLITQMCDNEVARVAIDVGGAAFFARHSRADEEEADSVAIGYLLRAGIDPHGIPGFFQVMLEEREREPGIVEGWFGTHPMEEERIDRTRQLLNAIDPATISSLDRGDGRLQAARQRLSRLPPAPPPPEDQAAPF
ncbi:MAG: M48 family metallopeptidase [Gemmatimonadaceae bacterium]